MVRLEGKDYEVKNTVKCDCGYEFTLKDMVELLKINQPGFYGNVVNHYSHAKCKKCGKEVLLFLKQAGQTWKIIDTAEEHKRTSTVSTQTVEKEPSNVIDEENNSSNEFICETCGKVCKSQIGLNSHMKTHQN